MKKLIFILLTLAFLLPAAAQRTPVKSHEWAFMGLEAGSGANWFQVSEPYSRSGFGFGDFFVGMHMEFLFGNRQQHGIFVNEGVQWLKGKFKSTEYDGQVSGKVINLYVRPGYKYTFRNAMFIEVYPQLDIPMNPTITDPHVNNPREYTPPATDKQAIGFGVGAGWGYNFSDNLAMVMRLTQSFTNMFDGDRADTYGEWFSPGACKGNLMFEMGFILGFGL